MTTALIRRQKLAVKRREISGRDSAHVFAIAKTWQRYRLWYQALWGGRAGGRGPVAVHRVAKRRLRLDPIEGIEGTPVVDIKPVLSGLQDFPAGKLVRSGL